MKFPKDALREAMWDGESYSLEGLKLVDSTGWKAVHKGEACDFIFSYEGKFYRVTDRRTGSDFIEWCYDSRWYWDDEVECEEVEKIEVITYKWVQKK
jgi:hypothetical protein